MFARMRKLNLLEWLAIAMVSALLVWVNYSWFRPVVMPMDGDAVTEEVEQVFFRTEKRHSGCPKNGFLRECGRPRMIEAYGINKAVWPHKCSACGATNEIYDARWPQIKAAWRVVK